MTAEPCAQRRKLHIVAVKEFEVLVVLLGHGEHFALKVKADFVLEQLYGEAAVVHVPAHSVVEVLGVFLVLENMVLIGLISARLY